MKYLKIVSLILLFVVSGSSLAQDKTDHNLKTKDEKVINDAQDAKAKLLKEDPSLSRFFENSAGYVIFPNVGKGGLIIGGEAGNGAVYEGGKLVGMAKLKKLSVGLQAGGQAIIEAVFFETQEALNEFKNSEFEFAAGASAVVLKEGKAVKAKYEDGIAVVALPKAGLMAEASVGGQKFSYHPIN